MQITQLLYLAALAGVVAYALWRGGWPERTVALAILLGSVASRLVENTTDWLAPQYGILAVDLALLAVLLTVVVRSSRLWPLWTAGFHLVGTAMHLAMGVSGAIWPWAYFTAMTLFGYLMLASVVWGVATSPKLRARPSD